MLAQLYYKYKETGIMISFCPDTNINFDEFMFTTDYLLFKKIMKIIFLNELVAKEKHSIIFYNIKDGKLSANIWRETIEYSKL